MSHHRSEIREAVRLMLDGATDAAGNVFTSRIFPIWDVSYPVILIYARDEASQSLGSLVEPIERRLQLAIEVRGIADETLDDVLDEVTAQVEDAIKADPTLRSTVLSCNLTGTDFDVKAEAEQPIGAARLTYEVIYAE